MFVYNRSTAFVIVTQKLVLVAVQKRHSKVERKTYRPLLVFYISLIEIISGLFCRLTHTISLNKTPQLTTIFKASHEIYLNFLNYYKVKKGKSPITRFPHQCIKIDNIFF